jgi:hypothetical protein
LTTASPDAAIVGALYFVIKNKIKATCSSRNMVRKMRIVYAFKGKKGKKIFKILI